MKNSSGNIIVSHSWQSSLYNNSRNDQSGSAMDNLTYRYATDAKGNILNNRLLHVNDAVRNNATTTDIKDQNQNDVSYEQQKPSTHNYDYDEIGNLIKDKSEQIAEIRWTVTGKVSDVIRTEESNKPKLHFDYDAMGQRIAKKVTNKNTTDGTDKFVTTYYMRDPQGNVLAVYEHKHGDSGNGTFTLAEQHLYGAGRLGMRKRDLALNTPIASETPATYYELTNHLGNVMAVISDEASTTDEPTIVSLSDYYPYGMTEPGRSYRASDYRYGFNGKEIVFDDSQDYGERIYKPNIARFLSADPLIIFNQEYPELSPYQFASNTPIWAIDLDGLEAYLAIAGQGHGGAWNKTHRKYFKEQAERLGNEYGYDVHTVTKGADILQILINATKKEGSISSIAFFTHGGQDGFYLNTDAGLYYSSKKKPDIPMPGARTWDDIEKAIQEGKIKFEENATIFIDACNVGGITFLNPDNDLELDALASKISRITGATVVAPVGHCEMKDQKKADGIFKISDAEVEKEGNKDPIYDCGPVGKNHAAFYKYNGGVESREEVAIEVKMDDHLNKREK